jgi:hypothetical protein
VDERNQAIERRLISISPGKKEPRDVARRISDVGILIAPAPRDTFARPGKRHQYKRAPV